MNSVSPYSSRIPSPEPFSGEPFRGLEPAVESEWQLIEKNKPPASNPNPALGSQSSPSSTTSSVQEWVEVHEPSPEPSVDSKTTSASSSNVFVEVTPENKPPE